MGQVSAVGQVHAHNGVARFEQAQEDRKVGLGAGVRLNVGMGRAEEFFDPIDGNLFNLIDKFAAAIVALRRQAFRIFVGQDRALRFHYCWRGEVFAGNEFKMIALTIEFLADESGDRGVMFGEKVRSRGHGESFQFLNEGG